MAREALATGVTFWELDDRLSKPCSAFEDLRSFEKKGIAGHHLTGYISDILIPLTRAEASVSYLLLQTGKNNTKFYPLNHF